MANLNSCSFIGSAGRSADREKSKDGSKEWASFNIAVNTGYGENKSTMWVKCLVFGKSFEIALEKVKRGDLIYVEGPLKVQAYVGKKDGLAKADVTLVANTWQWLGSSSKSSSPGGASPVEVQGTNVPQFDGNQYQNESFADIPF